MIIPYLKTLWFNKNDLLNKNKIDEPHKPNIVKDHEMERYIKKYSKAKSKTSIDAITWHDLELNKVYNKANYTYTSVGKESLFNYMMHPCHDEKTYNNRIKKIDKMATLDQLSVRKSLDSLGDFYGEFDSSLMATIKSIKMKLLILIVSLWCGIIFFLPILTTFTIPLIIIMGLVYFYTFSDDNKIKIKNFSYFINIAMCYLETEELTKDIYEENIELRIFSKKLIKIKSTISLRGDTDLKKQFYNMITFKLYRKMKRLDKILEEHVESIRPLIDRVADIDVLQSIVQLKASNDTFLIPNLKDTCQTISANNLKNILLDESVGNNINLNKSMIITGSNMSGKSTFLRTVGINVILAQSFGIVCSDSYESGFFKLTSAISLKDNISENKSYFMMEAECIKRMLEFSVEKNNHLFLIDEIFKGTNPLERLASAVEILNELTINQRVIATTHDIDILPELIDYNKFYFEHNVNENKLQYDYVLNEGVSDMKNAIKLMASIDYPEHIINKIYIRMDSNQSV